MFLPISCRRSCRQISDGMWHRHAGISGSSSWRRPCDHLVFPNIPHIPIRGDSNLSQLPEIDWRCIYQTFLRLHLTAPLLVTVALYQDLQTTAKAIRSSIISPRRKSDKTSAKGTEKPKGETRDIFDLAREFNKLVTQMAFEKFDFHQWFRYASQSNCKWLKLVLHIVGWQTR